jgi:hypothetical protein
MFEFLFKYPAAVFAKGTFVFLGTWPAWVLILLLLGALALLAWPFWRGPGQRSAMSIRRRLALWGLQTGFIALLLLMLWQPALSVSTLKPQQNIVAVVVDDSRSMAARESGGTRRDQAVELLDSGLLTKLSERFQVRLYRAGADLERISATSQLTAAQPSTRISAALRQVAEESEGLPIGAVVLLTDGAENSGGIDLATMNAIRRQRIPVHTVGFGRERLDRDIEVTGVDMPARALATSRIPVHVSLRQFGYEGQKARLRVKAADRTLASRDITLGREGAIRTEPVILNVGQAGARSLQVEVEPLANEENVRNNAVTRVLTVEGKKPRILYVEGEPQWEFKFIRRAADADEQLGLATMLRTTQNKIFRQGISGPEELSEGFPAKAEDLFAFQGLIVGGLEAAYFTPAQLELIRQFADRRGGGVLFLGGRLGLSAGGWGASTAADLLPVVLPSNKNVFRRESAGIELTAAGRDSILCRLEDEPARNAERWRKLPQLANYTNPGAPKPGAVVLAEITPASGGRMPLLVTQNYGRGRSAVLATAGTWRWQMLQPVADTSHETFWQQMLRWLAAPTPERVHVSTDRSVYTDEPRIQITASVRDKEYLPAADARVEAHVIGPGGYSETTELRPDPTSAGTYGLETSAKTPGTYVIEVVARRGGEEIGRDAITVAREDGVAENFHIEQNRDLLEKLAASTGGRYFRPSAARSLPDEITYSDAGISTRETRELWNMPLFFFLALLLKSSEWLLRRKWGVV